MVFRSCAPGAARHQLLTRRPTKSSAASSPSAAANQRETRACSQLALRVSPSPAAEHSRQTEPTTHGASDSPHYRTHTAAARAIDCDAARCRGSENRFPKQRSRTPTGSGPQEYSKLRNILENFRLKIALGSFWTNNLFYWNWITGIQSDSKWDVHSTIFELAITFMLKTELNKRSFY